MIRGDIRKEKIREGGQSQKDGYERSVLLSFEEQEYAPETEEED